MGRRGKVQGGGGETKCRAKGLECELKEGQVGREEHGKGEGVATEPCLLAVSSGGLGDDEFYAVSATAHATCGAPS